MSIDRALTVVGALASVAARIKTADPWLGWTAWASPCPCGAEATWRSRPLSEGLEYRIDCGRCPA